MNIADASPRSEEVGDRLREILGPGPGDIFMHSSADGTTVVVLHAYDRPQPGMTVYSTLNVNDVENLVDGLNMPVELLGLIQGQVPEFAAGLCTVAAKCIDHGTTLEAGFPYPNALRDNGISPQLPHLWLVEPLGFLARASVMHTKQGVVRGLQALPISDAELKYMISYGPDAVLAEFQRRQVPFWDLNRPSIF